MTDRWLLDNGFPKPVINNLAELDALTEYLHFADVFPAEARTSTPDWMLYLLAEDAGFVGVVTSDLGRARQRFDQVSWPERRSRSLAAVRGELRRRGRTDLGRLLDRS